METSSALSTRRCWHLGGRSTPPFKGLGMCRKRQIPQTETLVLHDKRLLVNEGISENDGSRGNTSMVQAARTWLKLKGRVRG